jgi:hypothetical protein
MERHPRTGKKIRPICRLGNQFFTAGWPDYKYLVVRKASAFAHALASIV